MLLSVFIKKFTKFLRILLLGDYRQRKISEEIANLIIKNYKNKLKIIDYGSGYFSPSIAELVRDLLIKKNTKIFGDKRIMKLNFLCLDLYSKEEIKKFNALNKKNIRYENINFLNKIQKKYDFCIISDVLHHVQVNEIKNSREEINNLKIINLLIKIKSKVKKIIIKDHFESNLFDRYILKILDFMGNYHNNTKLPYKYFTKSSFNSILKQANLKILYKIVNKRYYPKKFLFFAKRNLHFIYVTK